MNGLGTPFYGLNFRDGVGLFNLFAFPDGFALGVVGEDSRAAPRSRFLADRGNPFAVIGDDFLVLGTASEVVPLVGIVLHVVEFLGAIGVADVAPVLTANAVVVVVVCGDRRAVAFRFRVKDTIPNEANAQSNSEFGSGTALGEGGALLKGTALMQ